MKLIDSVTDALEQWVLQTKMSDNVKKYITDPDLAQWVTNEVEHQGKVWLWTGVGTGLFVGLVIGYLIGKLL
jgi:hypothetical protein